VGKSCPALGAGRVNPIQLILAFLPAAGIPPLWLSHHQACVGAVAANKNISELFDSTNQAGHWLTITDNF
jgi:hypothetical protein